MSTATKAAATCDSAIRFAKQCTPKKCAHAEGISISREAEEGPARRFSLYLYDAVSHVVRCLTHILGLAQVAPVKFIGPEGRNFLTLTGKSQI